MTDAAGAVYEWHVMLKLNGEIHIEVFTVETAVHAIDALPDNCGEIIALFRGRKLEADEVWNTED